MTNDLFETIPPIVPWPERLGPGTRLSLYQERDERHLVAPIVSVSLGLPAVFLLGG